MKPEIPSCFRSHGLTRNPSPSGSVYSRRGSLYFAVSKIMTKSMEERTKTLDVKGESMDTSTSALAERQDKLRSSLETFMREKH